MGRPFESTKIAAIAEITVLWDVMPCRLVDIHRRFCGTYCFQFKVEV
jgi:hypothetical protein